jgi:glycerol uptake facilitator-like aquaporin
MENENSVWENGKKGSFCAALFYEFLGTAVVTYAYNLGYKNYEIRAGAYLAVYLFAVNISGGHFNPATSLAVYLTEKDKRNKNLSYLLSVMLFQLFGAYFGILISYLLVKDYISTP